MSGIPFLRGSRKREYNRLMSLMAAGGLPYPKLGAVGSRIASIVKLAVPIWLVSRLLYLILTYAAVLLTMGLASQKASFAPDRLLTLWQRWDVSWYLSIAAGGYTNNPYRAAFFPLYPGLTAIVATLIGGSSHRLAAAMIVSSLGTLAACIGLGLLAEFERAPESGQESDGSSSASSIRVMLAYPLALFMFAGYADSLLVALCIFTLYFARRGHWWPTAVCAFAAGLTRPTAIILVLPLLFEYGQSHGLWQLVLRSKWRELASRLRPRLLGTWLLVVAATPLAICLYAAYLWRTFGDPLLFVHLQTTAWHRHLVSPWQLLSLVATAWQQAVPWGFDHAMMLVDEVPVALFGVLTWFIARRMSLTYTLYMLGVLFTSVATPMVDARLPLAAAGRYLLPAVPIYLLLGYWVRQRPWLDQLIIGGGMAVQAVLIVFFLNGGQLI